MYNSSKISEDLAVQQFYAEDFLQSDEWIVFQQAAGKKVFKHDSVKIIQHTLPAVGKYFYVPRWPSTGIENQESRIKELLAVARKNAIGWIRIDPESLELLENIKKIIDYKIAKAPHDMQPKEIFVIDISKPDDQLLSEMKSKTRYNIGVGLKKGVKIITASKNHQASKENIGKFLELTGQMAKRQGIKTHPEGYYKEMINSLPEDMLSIYLAEYNGKIIAANIVLFYKKNAIYLHGASSNEYRNVMAPYLLQWQAILDAKQKGCAFYDFGGVSTRGGDKQSKWEGITKFKLGFSQITKPVVFAGSYDIVIKPYKYALYRALQAIRTIIK